MSRGATTSERILDVSQLEAPEPFRIAVAALNELEVGEYLCLCHRREPFPLYETLGKLGFSYRVRDGVRTKFEILIWRADDPALTTFCGPAEGTGDDPHADPNSASKRGRP